METNSHSPFEDGQVSRLACDASEPQRVPHPLRIPLQSAHFRPSRPLSVRYVRSPASTFFPFKENDEKSRLASDAKKAF